MKNIVDKLNREIIKKKCALIVGLDPAVLNIPKCFFSSYTSCEDKFEMIENAIVDFNKAIIDSILDLVPAVKPQMAFYENYGWHGVRAFQKTVKYAKEKGLVVIEDAKRNDIGNTAKAYAEGHLGQVDLFNSKSSSFDVDFLTVTPFLGSDGIDVFVEECEKYGKGIFILVKTSNKSSGEIQDVLNDKGITISQQLAHMVTIQGKRLEGETGYSALGAVVGATYPGEAKKLRKIMKNNIFLVPGFGSQGGVADDVVSCFNEDGLGAIVNSSRAILYAYLKMYDRDSCTRENYKKCVRDAVINARDEIYVALKNAYPYMIY